MGHKKPVLAFQKNAELLMGKPDSISVVSTSAQYVRLRMAIQPAYAIGSVGSLIAFKGYAFCNLKDQCRPMRYPS